MRTRFLHLAVAALVATAFLTAACGDDDDDSGGGSTATATAAPGTATTVDNTPTPAPANGGDDENEDGEDVQLTITASGFAFDTDTISARPGQKVEIRLQNEDSAPHSITIGNTDVVVAQAGDDEDGSFTASEDMTEFHCKFHPQMTGTINVSEDAAADQQRQDNGSISGFGY
jgi:plastocyanin